MPVPRYYVRSFPLAGKSACHFCDSIILCHVNKHGVITSLSQVILTFSGRTYFTAETCVQMSRVRPPHVIGSVLFVTSLSQTTPRTSQQPCGINLLNLGCWAYQSGGNKNNPVTVDALNLHHCLGTQVTVALVESVES